MEPPATTPRPPLNVTPIRHWKVSPKKPPTTTAPSTTASAVPNQPNDLLKNFLKSGAHKNDPKKIQEMLSKFYQNGGGPAEAATSVKQQPAESEDDQAKSIFEKYAVKDQSPRNDNAPEIIDEEYYDDDYEEEEEEEETQTGLLMPKPWSPERKKGGSASSYFRKFASTNVGKSFRRPPPPADEDSQRAKDIFSKYASSKKVGGTKKQLPKTSYAHSRTSKATTTTTTTPTPKTTERFKKYSARFTTKKSFFWPTPRPFKPKIRFETLNFYN